MKIPSYTIEPPADELVSALAILSENKGRLAQKEYIFRLEDKGLIKDATAMRGKRKEVTKKGYAKAKRQYFERLQDKGWAVKKGKGRSSFIEITEEGKNTYETFVKASAVENEIRSVH